MQPSWLGVRNQFLKANNCTNTYKLKSLSRVKWFWREQLYKLPRAEAFSYRVCIVLFVCGWCDKKLPALRLWAVPNDWWVWGLRGAWHWSSSLIDHVHTPRMSGEARAATELREQTLHTIFLPFFFFFFLNSRKRTTTVRRSLSTIDALRDSEKFRPLPVERGGEPFREGM